MKIKAVRHGKTLVIVGSTEDKTYMQGVWDLVKDLRHDARDAEGNAIAKASGEDEPPEIDPGG